MEGEGQCGRTFEQESEGDETKTWLVSAFVKLSSRSSSPQERKRTYGSRRAACEVLGGEEGRQRAVGGSAPISLPPSLFHILFELARTERHDQLLLLLLLKGSGVGLA